MKRFIGLFFAFVIALCGCSEGATKQKVDSVSTLGTEQTSTILYEIGEILEPSEIDESDKNSEYIEEKNSDEIANLYIHTNDEKEIVCDDSIELVPNLKSLFESWEYKLEYRYYVTRCDTRVVCLVPSNFPQGVTPICIDSQSGEIISVESVLDTSNLADIVSQKVSLKYENSETVLLDFDETNFDWYLSYDRIHIEFGYESLEKWPDIGWNNYNVEILFAEYPDIFNPYYCEIPEQYSILSGFMNYNSGYSSVVYDIGQDGKLDTISIENSENDFYEFYESYGLPATLRVNDTEYYIETDHYGSDSGTLARLFAIIHVDNRDFLVCCLYIPEREMQYNIYDISDNQISYICNYFVYDVEADFSNPEKIAFVKPCIGLFSLPSYVYAHFSPEGEIVTDSEFQYAFDFGGEQEPMSTDFDINGVEVDEDGKVIGDYTIPAGTDFIAYRTSLFDDYSNENVQIFNDLLSENHIVRIFFDREIDEYGQTRLTYNGKRPYEYYELIQNFKVYQW